MLCDLFARDLLNKVIGILVKNGFPRLKSINLGFGPFSKGNFEKIKQCWNELTVGTSFEDVELTKMDVEGKIICQSCQAESVILETNAEESYANQEVIICPNCKSFKTKIIYGTEIYIVNLELNTSEVPG